MKILGYYVDRDGDKTIASDVYVAIDSGDERVGNFTYYCPIGQHGEGSKEYINECEEITKEEYLEATKLFYTPSDYI